MNRWERDLGGCCGTVGECGGGWWLLVECAMVWYVGERSV